MTDGVFAPRAQRQLNEILDYLERHAGEKIAETYARRFLLAVERIEAFPLSGLKRPELDERVRVVFVAPYIMFYDYSEADDIVQVTAIRHFRRLTEPADLG